MKSLVLFVFCATGIFIRLNVDTHAMNSPIIKQRIVTQQSYVTQLTIDDDPEYSNFSAHVVATDRVLNHRIIAIGSGEINGHLASLQVGDTITVKGFLLKLAPYEGYKKREHIVARFHVDDITNISPMHSLVTRVTSKLRRTVETGCSRLGHDERGVCEGLLIGERIHIDNSLYETYKQAQLTHLLVASGANIAFLVGFLYPLLSRMSAHVRAMSLTGIALFYCAATRFEPSMIRACAMVVIPAISTMRGTKVTNVRIFVFTVVACAFLDPFLLFRAGFWLSFSAAGGLYFLAPVIKPIFASTIIANTLAATLCVQPVLWCVFGYIAPFRWWVSVLAIAIAEPLSSAGLFGVIVASAAGSTSFLSRCPLFFMKLGCAGLNSVARFGASDLGLWLGWFFCAIAVIAYTYRYGMLMSMDREESVSGYKRVLHYR